MTIKAQKPVRDAARETRFLEDASGCAGTSRFIDHARARLEHGERRFGDQWTERSIREFLGEIREEAADLGGWSTLADQAITFRHPDCPAYLRRAFLDIARLGAQAHRIVEASLRMVDELNTSADQPTEQFSSVPTDSEAA